MPTATKGADWAGRPLRAVTGVRYNAYGCPVELLECGHDLLGLTRDSGEWTGYHGPRKRRRCEGCAEDAGLRTATKRTYRWHRRPDSTVEIRRGWPRNWWWSGWYAWTYDYNDQRPEIPWPS
jgi:hypothetical protein